MCPQKERYYVFPFPPPWLVVSPVRWEYPTACDSFDFLLVIVVRHTWLGVNNLPARSHRLSPVDWLVIVKHDWPSDPAKATTNSLNACCDVVFRMVKLRRPLKLCEISWLNSITTLFPTCLRLALPVTNQHPRLANGDSLRLTVWDSHPLNQPPFSGRA